MKINRLYILLFLVSFVRIFVSCKTYAEVNESESNKNVELQNNSINTAGIYISRDTVFALDRKYKNEINVRLLKLNENNTVQVSLMKYSYNEGEDKMNNENVTTWLDNHSLFNYRLISKNKIEISCYIKMPKRRWNDFATPSSVKIREKFKIQGNKLIRLGKSNKNFKKVYLLDERITNNHKNIIIGNACN
jgi:hypothetical protein